MVAPWRLEGKVRGQPAEARRAARAETSTPVDPELFARREKELGRIPGKSKRVEAIRYALARRLDLERFLHDGCLDIDSNIVERAIRPQTITRKNALFAGSDGGGHTWTTMATLLTTAKLIGVDPQAWLTMILERLAADWPNRLIDDLMPWNDQPASTQQGVGRALTLKGPMGLVIRNIGLARAIAYITLANMSYNMKRWCWLARRRLLA